MLVEGVVFAQSYSCKLGMISLSGQVGNTLAWLLIWVQDDSNDHYNGGPMLLGPFPSGT